MAETVHGEVSSGGGQHIRGSFDNRKYSARRFSSAMQHHRLEFCTGELGNGGQYRGFWRESCGNGNKEPCNTSVMEGTGMVFVVLPR